MKRLSCSMAITALWLGMLPGTSEVSAQHTVRGRVTYNPLMSECSYQEICERHIALGLYREEDWRPPTAAVNIAVRGTDQVAKTDRQGNYSVTVPSADATLVFMFIGFSRVEVPVAGRSVVDVKLTPMPLPVIERLLGLIMPQIHAMKYPDIDELARQADVNRETARDILWLVLGNRPMAAAYPSEFYPDYSFPDAPRTEPGAFPGQARRGGER